MEIEGISPSYIGNKDKEEKYRDYRWENMEEGHPGRAVEMNYFEEDGNDNWIVVLHTYNWDRDREEHILSKAHKEREIIQDNFEKAKNIVKDLL
jgi:hypothetical protein